ncbi:hypothetical protein ZWY2020_016023 [Hordeum vulgare]|nr:hypothetical protein ZWY2020_016023 [Hordeum vulgare]
MANLTAVAVTHMLHNKREFPFDVGARDLAVLSLDGNAAAWSVVRPSSSSLHASPMRARPTWWHQAVSMASGGIFLYSES